MSNIRNTQLDSAAQRGFFIVKKQATNSLLVGTNLTAEFTDAGALVWRKRYKRVKDGEWTRTTLGKYPEMSLSTARKKSFEWDQKLADDIDPIADRKAKIEKEKKAKTLAEVLQEWFDVMRKDAKLSDSSKREDARHVVQLVGCPAKDGRPAQAGLFPKGTMINDIKTPDISTRLDRIAKEDGHKAKARALRGMLRDVFKFAKGRGYYDASETNPCQTDLFDLPEIETENHPALLDPDDVTQLMKDIHGHTDDIRELTLCALQMLARTALRPANVAKMEWAWVRDDRIVIPIASMKIKKDKRTGKARPDHHVPITTQMRVVLNRVRVLTGNGRFVFSIENKPMGEKTLQRALRSMGYADRHVPHGFRTTFDSFMCVAGWSTLLIDRVLAHAIHNKMTATTKAYRRMDEMEAIQQERAIRLGQSDPQWDQRVEMMQYWSDWIDRMIGANVIGIARAA